MSLDHERQRLYKLVDSFIDTQNNLFEESIEYNSPRITNAMIVCSIDADNESNDVVENIVLETDSKTILIKLGLLDAARHLLFTRFE